jgi:hypothetical protein
VVLESLLIIGVISNGSKISDDDYFCSSLHLDLFNTHPPTEHKHGIGANCNLF